MFNGALSWEKAGDLARAANLYKKYLRVAAPDARDRDKAATSVADLSTRLGRLDLVREGARDVQLDGRALDEDASFTTPGEHVITWIAPDGSKPSRVATVGAGQVASVVLVEPSKPPDPKPPDPKPPDPKPPEAGPTTPPPPRSGITPWVAVSLGGATVVSGAILLWSGIDVLQAKSDYDQQRSSLSVDDQQTLIDEGRSKTDRTNVLIGITGALGVATVVTLIFTDFGSKQDVPAPKVGARVGPGSIALAGTF